MKGIIKKFTKFANENIDEESMNTNKNDPFNEEIWDDDKKYVKKKRNELIDDCVWKVLDDPAGHSEWLEDLLDTHFSGMTKEELIEFLEE
jgi:hypothetical protein